MPRPSNTHQRRAQIIAALRAVMPIRGYERASIQEIAKAAGLTAGLVHYHFSNKQEILLGLVDALSGELRARFERLAEGRAPGWGRLEALLRALLELSPEDADAASALACWITIGAEATRRPEVRALYEARAAQLLGLLEVEITEVLRGRGRDAGEAPALALALLAMIEGLFHLSQAAPSVIRAGEGLDLALAWARARLEGAP